jgi:hypothetical protein
MTTAADYLALIPSQHRDKPKFAATVSASVQPFVDMQELLLSLPQAFDIDEAVGVQLDAVGEWVGRNREVQEPITDVYFSWDTDGVGWNEGYWQGIGDPDYGITILSDEPYRSLLKAKVMANIWRGDIDGAYAILAAAFGDDNGVTIRDGLELPEFSWDTDGHGWAEGYWISPSAGLVMTVTIPGGILDPVQVAMINTGVIPLKPAGVFAVYE